MRTGFFLILTAIACGAFGAHALRDTLTDYSRAVFEKAALYHLVHGVALVAVAALTTIPESVRTQATKILGLGVLLFSGSLYLLAITGIKQFGAITPVGGVLMLLGWGYLLWRSRGTSQG